MYLQTEVGSTGNEKLLVIFLGVIAGVMVIQMFMHIATGMAANKAIKNALQSLEDLKSKTYPMIDSIHELSQATHALVRENAPKVRTITDNLVHTSEVVKGSAQQFDRTITDLNSRTQRQVATVDAMVATALATTAEMAETISDGIRAPAQKIAGMFTQARLTVEGMLLKAKLMANGMIAPKRG
jgi:methyl-accepting chemotaxis protein